MNYSECIAEVNKIKIFLVRTKSEDYFEFVINLEVLESLNKILLAFFGVVLKPAGAEPSKAAAKYAEDYGGIRKNQTLYYLEKDSVSYCTLLWPWGDGKLITVKMANNPT